MGDIELIWKGKKTEVDKIILPFQKIETVNVSRTGKNTLLSKLNSSNDSWRNKLIWGDNKFVLSSLLKDPSIAGKIKLVYIDPPFSTGTNMNINIKIGDSEVTKEPSAIEEVAYRNMWREGPSSFLQYMYDRIKLIRELLSEDGSIYVRFDYRYSHHIKVILDEIFGYNNFQNEIILRRINYQGGVLKKFNPANEVILYYTKSDNHTFNSLTKIRNREPKWVNALSPKENKLANSVIINSKKFIAPPGEHWRFSQKRFNLLLSEGRIRINEKNGIPQYLESSEVWVDTDWTDISGYSTTTGYPTENSEQVLQRVIAASSNEGDIVADFFCGSGTTVAVAEKMNRKWIGCDIGRFSIHTIRKRLLEIPTCKPFEVLNMGKYERKYWATETLGEDYKNYVNFILQLYNAKPVDNFVFIHGKKGSKGVHVGLVDSPVSKKEIFDTLTECKKAGFESLDVLGWEWEMGLNDSIIKEIDEMFKIKLSLWVIPREVMDKRAVESGDIDFYELAHLQVDIVKEVNDVKVALKDFIIPNPDLIPPEVQNKINKWSDFIDYWAVDWNFDGTFHNQWQIYRTKELPVLKTETGFHKYQKGKYTILIKVVDIFGNDTSTLREIVIK